MYVYMHVPTLFREVRDSFCRGRSRAVCSFAPIILEKGRTNCLRGGPNILGNITDRIASSIPPRPHTKQRITSHGRKPNCTAHDASLHDNRPPTIDASTNSTIAMAHIYLRNTSG